MVENPETSPDTKKHHVDMLNDKKIIWTIGHSTRTFEEFVSMLAGFQIQHVIDIRRFPGSKRFPQYNKEILAPALSAYSIKYTHMEALGGRRNPRPDSTNTAWRVKGFRGYADYMESDGFKKAITELEQLAMTARCAFMCTEAVWWSCHRALVSDYLKVNGWAVMHIMTQEKAQEHSYTKAATITRGVLNYAGRPNSSNDSAYNANQLF
jgi:uncharacterized protein (DUF488 family)